MPQPGIRSCFRDAEGASFRTRLREAPIGSRIERGRRLRPCLIPLREGRLVPLFRNSDCPVGARNTAQLVTTSDGQAEYEVHHCESRIG